MCDMTHSYVGHDSFICVTWLIHMCDMTHSYVRLDAFMCVTWLIHMCDMTHLCMCDMARCICVTCLIHVWRDSSIVLIYVWHDSLPCLMHTWHDSPQSDAFMYDMTHTHVTCHILLIHICDMLHPYVIYMTLSHVWMSHMWHVTYVMSHTWRPLAYHIPT